MVTLSDEDRARIAEAVTEAEKITSVELRLVLSHASSHYAAFALIWPALLALAAGGLAATVWPFLPAVYLFMGEAALFVVAVVVLQLPGLRRALVPASVRRRYAWRQARINYAAIGLQNVVTRHALLLFCSVAERYVEILVDDAVAQRLPEAEWQPVVEQFKRRMAERAIAPAFIEGAQACAALLAPHFPSRVGEANELPDSLLELP